MDPASIAEMLDDWGYPALLVLLFATGIGSPVPEDLLLVSGGYLISADVFSWRVTLPLALTGVVASDVMLYGIGRRLRVHSQKGWVARWVRPERLTRVMPWFTHLGPAAVFVARLVPGTRALVFVSAGLQGIRLGPFVAYDLAGASIWVPLMLKLGSELGDEIGGIQALVAAISRAGFWIVIAALALLIAWRFRRAEQSKW